MFHSFRQDRRRGFLALLAGLALATALATGLLPNAHSEAHEGGSHHHSDAHATSRAAFQDQMRKLWEDHVTWTRLAIVTFADGSPSFEVTAARLMQNQDDIGDAIKPFYGKAAGEKLTALLKDHIGIAVQLLQAAKVGDDQAFQAANAAWYQNADDIAGFLAKANPRDWPKATMRAAMRTHLDQTLAEASHELGGQYTASVKDYDEIHHHILDMADVLSSGIIHAFPNRFH